MTPEPQSCDKTSCWAYKEGYCYALCSRPAQSAEQVLKDLTQHLKDDLKFSDERGDQNMSDMTSPSFQYYVARSATLEHVLDKIAELQQRGREP